MTTQVAPPNPALALAEAMSGRLCHDLAGMVGTVMGALELAHDDETMRDEALPMAAEAAAGLGRRLGLMRAAWGGEGCEMTGQDLRALATGLPSGRRVRVALDGLVPDRIYAASTVRLLLNLLLLAVESLAGEGSVALMAVSQTSLVLSIEGPRATWPTGFAGDLADHALARQSAATCSPRLLQGPLTALIAHASSDRISILFGSETQVAAPLLIEMAPAPAG